jgi:hypothetical protein
MYREMEPPWMDPARTTHQQGRLKVNVLCSTSNVMGAQLSLMPLHILIDRLSRPMMPYHNGISVPLFMVTFLMGAVGRINLA